MDRREIIKKQIKLLEEVNDRLNSETVVDVEQIRLNALAIKDLVQATK